MPVFALYNFDETGSPVLDSALGNGAQNGKYINGATPVGGLATLDGVDDLVKIFPDPSFQMDRGTLEIQFSQTSHVGNGPNTILSRDSVGNTAGGYRIDVLANGAIAIVHETPTGSESFGTPADFLNPGDEINLTYSWDEGGSGGRLVIENLTTGTTFDAPVPNTLTMDQGGINQPWIIGAGQTLSNPDQLNDINQHFNGTVEMFSISDTVDNNNPDPVRDGIVTGTAGADLIDTSYIDPTDADRVDANDAILPGEVGNDDIIRAGDGNDTIIAGLGNDEVEAGNGNDSVNGNEGDDSILGQAGNDSVFGDVGNDTIIGGDGDDEVVGGDGNDVVDGGAGDDALQGNEGNDALTGGAGNDTMLGGNGDDTLFAGELGSPDRAYPGLYAADGNPDDDRDSVVAGIGNDVVTTGDDADTVLGGDGEDTIYGGFDADRINGGNDDDVLLGEEGSDTLIGDAGNDLILGGTLENTGPTDLVDAVDLDDANNRDSLQGGAGNDTILGGDDDDTLEGGDGADLLDGGIDEDSITGDAGDDTIIGGQGNDTVDGGAGNDRLTDGAGADVATGGADRDTFVGATAGDRVDGSETGDDFDTLDLRGVGPISIAFDPANAENGTVTFLDGAGAPTGTMNFINIENVLSDLPDANPDTATTPEDTAVTIPVLANDTDGNGQPLTISGTPTAPNGTVTVNADGTITYTPDEDFNGTDTITYTVTDPDGNTSTSTVTVTVTPVNDAPVANDDTATTPEDTPVVIGVLGNDTDPDGDTLTVVGTPTSPNGTVAVNPDGTLTFTPTPDFTGTTTITYEVSDGNGGTDTAVVNVTVTPASDAPVANPDTAETDEDTPVVIPVLANDTDPDGQSLTVTGGTAPNGTVTVNPDGTISYTPNPNFNGEDTITYTVTDPDGNEATSTVTVTVNPVNDAPEANPDTSTTPFNTPVTFAVLANDRDVDGDTLSIIGTPTSPNGTVARNPDGTLTFTPTTGFTGAAVVTYTITDEEGLTDTTTWTITVGEDDTRDGIVFGTGGDDLIDVNYLGDNDGDRVDATDALLPGAAPNDDFIIAGAGNDTILAGLGDDSVRAGTGNDSVRGNSGDDTINGQGGNDTLFGNDGDDTLIGEAGDDSLNGGNGDDSLAGGAGNDTLIGEDGNDNVRGMDGDDVIDTSGNSGTPLPDVDYPGLYPADPTPLNDLDTVFGGAGNDTIRTGDDADQIFGGTGNDSIDAGIDNDSVVGGDGDDSVTGSEGRDTIFGNSGNDLIYGGLPVGVLDGLNIPDATDLRPLNNADSLFGGEGNDTIFGQDDADTLFGGTGNDSLDGGIDNDSIVGGIGNDTIIGGQGADTMAGGADRDVFVGANANDVIDGNEAGDDFDTLDLTGSGPLRIVYADDNPENGTVTFLDADGNPTGTMNFVNIENVIPCFTPGTMIATPRGEVPVETLRAGDKIVTRDNGLQEIRWVGQKALSWQDMAAAPHLRPVLVKRGSLGNGLPERDMMVSPNHRLLVANDRTALYFDEHEVLVSAKHLVGSTGIHAVESMQTTYIHFMFDQHEVVLSDGAWTESFQPGDYTLKGMGNAQRNEIFELFPDLKTVEGIEGYTAARKTLKRHEARLLVR
jgi:Ca2+-binding RTX toxin-like protein